MNKLPGRILEYKKGRSHWIMLNLNKLSAMICAHKKSNQPVNCRIDKTTRLITVYITSNYLQIIIDLYVNGYSQIKYYAEQ